MRFSKIGVTIVKMILYESFYYVKGFAWMVLSTLDQNLAEKEEYVITAIVTEIEDYILGQFYRRELQSVESIIRQIKIEDIEMIIVDGYADSGTEEHLSMRNIIFLFLELEKISMINVYWKILRYIEGKVKSHYM